MFTKEQLALIDSAITILNQINMDNELAEGIPSIDACIDELVDLTSGE